MDEETLVSVVDKRDDSRKLFTNTSNQSSFFVLFSLHNTLVFVSMSLVSTFEFKFWLYHLALTNFPIFLWFQVQVYHDVQVLTKVSCQSFRIDTVCEGCHSTYESTSFSGLSLLSSFNRRFLGPSQMCQFCVRNTVQSKLKYMVELNILHVELVISIKVLSLKGNIDMLLVRIKPAPNNPHLVFLLRNLRA